MAPMLLSRLPNGIRREVVAALNARLTSRGAARALQLLYPILQLVSLLHLLQLHLLLQIFLSNFPVVVTLKLLPAHLGVKVQGLVWHQTSQLVIIVTMYVKIATQILLLLLRNLLVGLLISILTIKP
jgi:hypothetical protein